MRKRGGGGGVLRGQDNYSTRNSTLVNKAGRPENAIDEQLEQFYVWPPVCR
jgi:hypothetical protein